MTCCHNNVCAKWEEVLTSPSKNNTTIEDELCSVINSIYTISIYSEGTSLYWKEGQKTLLKQSSLSLIAQGIIIGRKLLHIHLRTQYLKGKQVILYTKCFWAVGMPWLFHIASLENRMPVLNLNSFIQPIQKLVALLCLYCALNGKCSCRTLFTSIFSSKDISKNQWLR